MSVISRGNTDRAPEEEVEEVGGGGHTTWVGNALVDGRPSFFFLVGGFGVSFFASPLVVGVAFMVVVVVF